MFIDSLAGRVSGTISFAWSWRYWNCLFLGAQSFSIQIQWNIKHLEVRLLPVIRFGGWNRRLESTSSNCDLFLYQFKHTRRGIICKLQVCEIHSDANVTARMTRNDCHRHNVCHNSTTKVMQVSNALRWLIDCTIANSKYCLFHSESEKIPTRHKISNSSLVALDPTNRNNSTHV